MSVKRIAVIGAGPIGLETALYAATLGHDVQVYERRHVGENVRSWGHVTLFSPWKLNHSPLGERALHAAGIPLPEDPEAFLTGARLVEAYLAPLAQAAPLTGRVQERCRVIQIGRERFGKAAPLGAERRGQPFRLLLDGTGGESQVHADVVIDCSGTYGHHNWLGSGNVPALGERRLKDRIAYTLEDIRGAARFKYAGRRVMLVGTGYSAATALEALIDLPGTNVIWISRESGETPYRPIENDALPQRHTLAQLGNSVAGGSNSAVTFRPETDIERIDVQGFGLKVTLRRGADSDTADVDRILALVGYRPDNTLYRELQVHECYATSGPMPLASALMKEGSSDCLTQSVKGAESLINPEPDFFILGSKSYGRDSHFLMQVGLEQIRELFAFIENRPGLDLYAENP